jgi:ZIP family zinc transporter
VTAALLGFASGALITAVAFELFEDAFRQDAWRAGTAFAAGATTFVLVDTWLERRTARRSAAGAGVGFARLARGTLDGVPENQALGVALLEGGAPTLLIAVFFSNLPEAIVGSEKMREAGLGRNTILAIWGVTAVVLGVAVVAGYAALSGVPDEELAWPLGFAAGGGARLPRRHADAGGIRGGRPVGRVVHGARLSRLVPRLGRMRLEVRRV